MSDDIKEMPVIHSHGLIKREHHSHDEKSQHTHDHQHDHDDAILSLRWAVIGMGLLLNSFLLEKYFVQEDASMICGLLGALVLTLPIVIKAVQDLLAGHYHMNELVAIAVVSCLTLEDYRTAGVVAFFMILADLVEHKTASGARSAIEGLLELTPTKARKITAEGEVEVEASHLHKNDKIIVKPGEQIAVDGVILKGSSAINQSNITGESLPVDKAERDTVYAGTLNLSGVLEIEVTKTGDETTLGKVKSLILSAQQTRLPIMSVIDKYIGWYTPAVLMIAVIVLFVTQKLEPSITILILSCPCSIILATPTAMVAALSAASRVGILIKDVKEFERAARIDSVVFDKTGTLTTGNLSVTRMNPKEGVDAKEFLTLASSIDQFSNHPVAKAVVSVAVKANLNLLKADHIKEVAGQGVEGTINGKKILVGRKTWLEEQGIKCELPVEDGLSILFVAWDNEEKGWIGLEDKSRDEAKQAITDLRKLGVKRISLFTGDRLSVAQKVSDELGCDELLSDCLPEEKLTYVTDLKGKGDKVAVVGDGVNDAAALAAGDLGVAMATGSDVAIGSSSVAMLSTDLRKMPFLLRLSKLTRKVVYQNLLFGVLFIFVVSSFAILEYVNPIIGGILHFFSSFIVIFNSFRIVRSGEEFTAYQPNS